MSRSPVHGAIGGLHYCSLFVVCLGISLLLLPAFVSNNVNTPIPPVPQSLFQTTTEAERSRKMKLLIGIDAGDVVLDAEEGEGALAQVFRDKLDFEIVRIPAIPTPKQLDGNLVAAADDTSGHGRAAPSAFAAACSSPATEPREGQVCRVWRELAQEALKQGAEYTMLVGDDVRLRSPGWMSTIQREFEEMRADVFERRGVSEDAPPVGFGVVSFTDERSPGFPGFPVLHRTHHEIFPDIFPAKFVNQDADPWIFEVYNRFGAARVSPTAILDNTLGGCDGDAANSSLAAAAAQPRYRKVAVDWKAELLRDGVQRVRAWLEARRCSPGRIVVLDVLVPTVRLDDLSILRKICSLEVPPYMRTVFIVIVDDPAIAASRVKSIAEELQKAAGNSTVRVRQNKENIGAGPSRNRALDESCADWGLFLDDDVQPKEDILAEYGRLIIETEKQEEANDSSCNGNNSRSNTGGAFFGYDGSKAQSPRHAFTSSINDDTNTNGTPCCGFIGITKFPRVATALHRAVTLSDVTFMYGISGEMSAPAWGVTANLLVRFSWSAGRRSSTRFGNQFPKTGGGEDVDFCLRHAKDAGGTFVSAKSAVVIHPWWPGGRFKTYRRFLRWSFGDGQLIRLHPRFSYRSVPNVAEMMLLMPLYLASFYLTSLAFRADDVVHGGYDAASGDPVNGDPVNGGDDLSAACAAGRSGFNGEEAPPQVVARSTALIVTLLALLPPLVRAFLRLAAMLLTVLIAEMACDIARNTLSRARRNERLAGVGVLPRVTAAAESSCIITALEVGRLAGQWSRGGLGLLPLGQGSDDEYGRNGGALDGPHDGGIVRNFCRRFDWHCGRLSGAVEYEIKRSVWKLTVSHALLVLLMLRWTSVEHVVGVVLGWVFIHLVGRFSSDLIRSIVW
ncbi:unnamed protein product [Scytosiphon promiscuus]